MTASATTGEYRRAANQATIWSKMYWCADPQQMVAIRNVVRSTWWKSSVLPFMVCMKQNGRGWLCQPHLKFFYESKYLLWTVIACHFPRQPPKVQRSGKSTQPFPVNTAIRRVKRFAYNVNVYLQFFRHRVPEKVKMAHSIWRRHLKLQSKRRSYAGVKHILNEHWYACQCSWVAYD